MLTLTVIPGLSAEARLWHVGADPHRIVASACITVCPAWTIAPASRARTEMMPALGASNLGIRQRGLGPLEARLGGGQHGLLGLDVLDARAAHSMVS